MVVPSPSPALVTRSKRSIRVVDLSEKRSSVSKSIVSCCEESGIFKVVNHGVSMDVVSRIENEGLEFFSRPTWEKQKAGPAKPYGYGCKTIGFKGDIGQLEYLLLQTQQPCTLSHGRTHFECPKGSAMAAPMGWQKPDEKKKPNPINVIMFTKKIGTTFLSSCTNNGAVRDYVQSVRDLACEVLDLVAEGLGAPDKAIFSRLIRDVESDCVLRLNHYPPSLHVPSSDGEGSVGFGEHTDPQILTILRSNDVDGLHICTRDGRWVAVPSDPDAFFVMVGDALQVMTNGRFESVKHRVIVSMGKRRMSTMYFGAPSLDTQISPIPQLMEDPKEFKYKAFTWSEYKKAAYASRLSDCRLNLFKRQTH